MWTSCGAVKGYGETYGPDKKNLIIFEAFTETRRTKVWVATSQESFPILVLTTFLVIFGFTATMLTPSGSVQTLKIVDFDPKYLKVQIPIFQKFFGSDENFGKGGGAGYPHPISEIVSYDGIQAI